MLPSLTDIGGFAATRGCTPCAAYAAIPAHPQKRYTRRWRLYHFCGFYYPIREVIPIAIYHWNIGIVSRGKGKSAVAAAAYRSGEKLTNEWDGMTHDYTRKGGVVHTEIMLPSHAPPSFSDRSTLWNSVELYEKAGNAQLAREIDAALPIELSREEQIRLVREYCSSQFVSRGMCVDYAIHDTDSGNPHCHIMLTMRPLDERGTWAAKSKKEYDLDENGERIRLPSGRYKTHKVDLTGWNDKDNTLLWRKDWNEVLQHRAEITDGKYMREAVYGLKEPPQEETVEIIRMSEVDTQTVEWLWEPYIPFGKVTIVQGNPGEGKTTFALRLAAACTTGGTLPGMKPLPPFQVIYQTAEDGLGDTVKPRLIEAEADLDRVLVIDEAKRELTLSDERIEKAITQNGARLIILDPIQAYMGEKTDMNRANEVRPMFRRLADVAERTGCAVILIGHLNKAAGGQSAYRGLGSIDFRAAARSVLLIGRVKREPNVRVIVHDKSSLAPEGKPVAFCLDPETGFSWVGEYDITADELLSGAGGNTATKTEQAERLILDLLADGKELASEDIVKAAAEAGISERTVQNAKRNMGGILGARRVGGQWYNFIKKKQPPETAS